MDFSAFNLSFGLCVAWLCAFIGAAFAHIGQLFQSIFWIPFRVRKFLAHKIADVVCFFIDLVGALRRGPSFTWFDAAYYSFFAGVHVPAGVVSQALASLKLFFLVAIGATTTQIGAIARAAPVLYKMGPLAIFATSFYFWSEYLWKKIRGWLVPNYDPDLRVYVGQPPPLVRQSASMARSVSTELSLLFRQAWRYLVWRYRYARGFPQDNSPVVAAPAEGVAYTTDRMAITITKTSTDGPGWCDFLSFLAIPILAFFFGAMPGAIRLGLTVKGFVAFFASVAALFMSAYVLYQHFEGTLFLHTRVSYQVVREELSRRFGVEGSAFIFETWQKCKSLTAAIGRYYERVHGFVRRQTFTAFGRNKSLFKAARGPMLFESVEYDRVANSNYIRGSARRPMLLRKLKGHTEFTHEGRVYRTNYPIRVKVHLIDYLRRGGDPRGILDRNFMDPRTLVYFSVSYGGTITFDVMEETYKPQTFPAVMFLYAVSIFLFREASLLGTDSRGLLWNALYQFIAWPLFTIANTVTLSYVCTASFWWFLVPVVFEEIAKVYVRHVLGFMELFARLPIVMSGNFVPFAPFAMHVVSLFVPVRWWILRVLLHAFWNYFSVEICSYRCVRTAVWPHQEPFTSLRATISMESIVADTIDITRVGQLVLLAVERNFKQFLMSLYNFDYVRLLVSFFKAQFRTAEDVVDEFALWMQDFNLTAGEGIVAVLSKLLPKSITRSPTTVAAIAVASCLMSSFFLGSYEKLSELLPLVDFSSMKTGEVVAVAIDGSLTIVRSAFAAYKSGNLWDFFVRPKAFRLRMALNKYHEKQEALTDAEYSELAKLEEEALYANDVVALGWVARIREKAGKLISEGETMQVVAQAMELVGRKPKSVEDNEGIREALREMALKPILARQTALLSKMYERIEALEKNANGSKTRRPPLTLVLLGLPGTGKTTLYDQIIQFYARTAGVTIDKSHVARLQLEAKHPIEGAFPNTKVLIINDMVADHSKGLQQTSFSVGAMLQSIMDSEPLKFPSASVSSKGASFPDVELFIITTNERCFVMPESTERLQRRFDELAVIVDVAIVGNDGRCMKEEEFSMLSVQERNSRTKAQLLSVVCTGKTYAFSIKRSNDFVPIKWFWLFLKEKIRSKKVKEEASAEVLKKTCKCGVLPYSHYENGVWGPIHEGVCEEFELGDLPKGVETCSCRLLKDHPFNPIWDHALAANERQLAAKASLSMPTRRASFEGFSRRLADDDVELTSLTFDLVWYGALMAGFYYLFGLAKTILLLVKSELEKFSYMADEFSIRFLELVASYDTFVGSVAATKAKVVAQYLRARQFLRKYQYVIGLSSIVLLAYKLIPSSAEATAKIVVRENVDSQSMVFDSFTQEVTYPPGVAKEWNKVPMPMPVVELSSPGVSIDDLMRKVKTNTVEFTVEDGRKEKHGFLLIINATLAVSNLHYFFDDEGRSKEVLLCMKDSRVMISAVDVFRIGRSECVLVRHSFPGVWRDLLPCFADEVTVKQLKCRYSKDESDHLVSIEKEGFFVGHVPIEGPVWKAVKDAPDGDCGQCMVGVSTKGQFILGTVSFRHSSPYPWGPVVQGGCVITRSQIVETIQKMHEPVVRSFDMTAYEKELEGLQALPPQSSFRTVVSPYLQILGSQGKDDKKFNSSLKETSMAQFVRDNNLLSKKYGIPRRISKVENGVFKSAFMKTIAEINFSGFLPSSHLRDACHEYIVHVLTGVRKASGDITLSPLSLEDAFFGQAAQNVTRCNFKTSIGPEDRDFFKTRNDLFEEINGQYVLASSFKDKLQETLNTLKRGDVKTPWVSGSYKDEVRSEEKLEQMAIRLFYTVDIYNNTLARMYLVPLASCLLDHPFVSRCFGKMNSGSKEWDDLFKWLSQQPNVLDLDFKHYDISHAQRIIREVAYFFYRLAQHWYKNEESALVVYLLVFALCCQLFEHKGDFALKFKGLPSGHIVTLILNCVANVILMVAAFKLEYPSKSFWEETRGAVVGDDNVTSVSDGVKEKFNLVNLVRLYAEWGYEITDAAKSGEIKPFTNFADVQFLKRKFRFDEEIGEYVAPLEKDSIYKMLSYWTAKGSGTTYEQRMSDCFEVAQREMFLWGRREFDSFREQFKPEVDRQRAFLVHWFNFDELMVEYRGGGEGFMHWTAREYNKVELTSSICTVDEHFPRNLIARYTTLGTGRKYADSEKLETVLSENFSLAELNSPTNILTEQSNAPNDVVAAPEHAQFKSYTPDRANTFVVDEYSGFVNQPVLFAASSWTTSSLDTVIAADLFKSYVTLASNSTYLWRKLANFMFVDSWLTVTIVVQGSSVAQGKIVYSFDPLPRPVPVTNTNTHVPEAQKTRAFLLPHIEINPAESKTYTIDLPAPTVWGVYSLSKNTNSFYDLGSYRMKQHIINRLGSGTDTVPEIGITIYLSLKGGRMSSKTLGVSFTSLEVEKKAPDGGVLSRFFRKAADVASYGSMVPIPAISEGATLFSKFSEGTANLLSWFGFSKPLIFAHQSSWIRAVNNFSRVDGNVQSELLSLRTNNSVSIAMDDFPLGDSSMLTTTKLCATNGLIHQFEIETSASPGALLATIGVSPFFQRALSEPAIVGGLELTPLAYAAFPYQFWRGELVFTFESVCSVFHRATILILYDPVNHNLTPPYIDAAPALQHWTMAINGSSKLEVRIPWKQMEHYKQCTIPSTNINDGNGRLTIALLNAVTTNGSTDPIHVNVFVRGEDMAFGGARYPGGSPLVLTAMERTSDTHFFGKYFGEEHAHTVKELASKMTPQFQFLPVHTTAPIGRGYMNVYMPVGSNIASTSNSDQYLSLVDFISMAFVGTRGSYNYSFFPDSQGSDAFKSTFVTLEYATNSNPAASIANGEYYPAIDILWNPFTYALHKINPSVEFTVPHYCDGLFRPTYYRSGGAPQPQVRMHSTFSDVPDGVTLRPSALLLKGGGDDFTLIGFRGIPVMLF